MILLSEWRTFVNVPSTWVLVPYFSLGKLSFSLRSTVGYFKQWNVLHYDKQRQRLTYELFSLLPALLGQTILKFNWVLSLEIKLCFLGVFQALSLVKGLFGNRKRLFFTLCLGFRKWFSKPFSSVMFFQEYEKHNLMLGTLPVKDKNIGTKIPDVKCNSCLKAKPNCEVNIMSRHCPCQAAY